MSDQAKALRDIINKVNNSNISASVGSIKTNAKVLTITSGKGGVGKTTIVSNLGLAIAALGYKVLLVDMDFGLNNLDVLMGIENKIVYDIIDVGI